MMLSFRPVVTCQARSAEMPLAPVVNATLSLKLSRFHWPVGPWQVVAGGQVSGA